MAQPRDDNVDPARSPNPREKSAKRTIATGRPGPDPARVAQFAALTFLVGAAFLLVGYVLS
jgi:hypothetical protein